MLCFLRLYSEPCRWKQLLIWGTWSVIPDRYCKAWNDGPTLRQNWWTWSPMRRSLLICAEKELRSPSRTGASTPIQLDVNSLAQQQKHLGCCGLRCCQCNDPFLFTTTAIFAAWCAAGSQPGLIVCNLLIVCLLHFRVFEQSACAVFVKTNVTVVNDELRYFCVDQAWLPSQKSRSMNCHGDCIFLKTHVVMSVTHMNLQYQPYGCFSPPAP